MPADCGLRKAKNIGDLSNSERRLSQNSGNLTAHRVAKRAEKDIGAGVIHKFEYTDQANICQSGSTGQSLLYQAVENATRIRKPSDYLK